VLAEPERRKAAEQHGGADGDDQVYAEPLVGR